MRILVKLVLFPLTLVLSLVVAVCRCVCYFSSALLGVVATIFFVLALGCLVLLRDPSGALLSVVLAFLVSPFGIPALAMVLVEGLASVNDMLRSI